MTNYELERQKELETRKARSNELATMAAAVAAALGETWHALPGRKPEFQIDVCMYFRIAHADGRSFSMGASDYRWNGKIDVSGDYPQSSELGVTSTPHGMTRPAISLSLSRGAAAIAKDIARRFLPDYTALYLKMLENVRNAAVERAHRGGISLRLAELAGCDMSLSTRHDGGFWHASHDGFSAYKSGATYPEIKVGYGSIDVKVNGCSEALAAKILALVNDQRDQKGGAL